MTKYLLAAAAVAALALSGAAFAEDGKSTSTQQTASKAAAAPKAMTDAQMDKVTAGFSDNAAINECCGQVSLINHGNGDTKQFFHANMPAQSANGFRGTGP